MFLECLPIDVEFRRDSRPLLPVSAAPVPLPLSNINPDDDDGEFVNGSLAVTLIISVAVEIFEPP
ncbi:hypothetical protein DERF_006105 [Dermatophagoides farinae]|uniref:Uncharacterized protein n=1 Tax=Dermatophagoides farinae TaxID=6954 RepID=A0A922I5K9_DERFA|nr:hypothetical protein DERF_006105 [Dermatophagoides farinae]